MKKIILPLLGVMLLVGAVGAGVFLVKRSQDLRSKAAPATTLSFSPATKSTKVGDTFDVNVAINTGSNQVIAAELYINFNATVLELTALSSGAFFTNPQVIGPTINNSAGSASYTLYLPAGAAPKTGSGTLAKLTFKAKAAGTASLTFASNTLIGATGEGGQNVLSSKTPGTVTVSASTATATATATATGTATATATATATGTGTATPTATPTKSPGIGGGATSTPIPTDFPIPETGTSWPTVIGAGAGILLILTAFLLAL